MTDLDALLSQEPIAAPSLSGAVGKPARHRHKWETSTDSYTNDLGEVILRKVWRCDRCGTPQDAVLSRRGRLNRKRGNSLELWFCRALSLEKVGQMGTEVDGRSPENRKPIDFCVCRRPNGGHTVTCYETMNAKMEEVEFNARMDGLAASPLFVAQVKSGQQYPGWMQKILDQLPRTGGRIPILGIVATPGPGNKRRALVVMTLDDFRDLHGGGSAE